MGNLVKYPANALMGGSLYDVVHAADVKSVEESFKTRKYELALSRFMSYTSSPTVSAVRVLVYLVGQTVTDVYRMLAYGGGYVYVVTQASLILNQKTSRPEQISCVHQVIRSAPLPLAASPPRTLVLCRV